VATAAKHSGKVVGTVTLELIVDKNAVACEAAFRGSSGRVTGVGSSKRNKNEVFDHVVGERLAVSRALIDLARKIHHTVEDRL
jgi:Domain of unknown function (DUF1876)